MGNTFHFSNVVTEIKLIKALQYASNEILRVFFKQQVYENHKVLFNTVQV